jgi:activating signal cointegrator complex subunit 3
MIGRAGRPGFDTSADAVVMVRAEMKEYYKRFLYSAFPVESCLEQRINENLNAEIASATIHTISDCVGYLSWTYFARRVKKNPMYYGAESSDPEDVDARMLDFVKQSIEALRSEGCVEVQDLDEFAEIKPTTLGIAASQYYLSHRTPKQMQVGIREGRKIILKAMRSEKDDPDAVKPTSTDGIAQSFIRSRHVDEPSIAWLLFALCSTHEFDELPVRHNEEHLNEDLSHDVMWGPDVADVLRGNSELQRQYRNPEIYLDPHTKGFLLVQAYLEHTKLPISDYVNDTKSVMENLPRLLAAMSYIASAECDTEGTFELLTQFTRTRQLLAARCKVNDDPLQQLPGITADIVQRLMNGNHKGAKTLLGFRSLQRKDAIQQMQTILRQPGGPRAHRKDDVLNILYGLPLISFTNAVMHYEQEKGTNKGMGKLSVTVDVERCNTANPRSDMARSEGKESSHTLTMLLGSYNQRFLLASCTLRISRFGTWTATKDLTFDWERAKLDGNKVVLRLLIDEVRGLDHEVTLNM